MLNKLGFAAVSSGFSSYDQKSTCLPVLITLILSD